VVAKTKTVSLTIDGKGIKAVHGEKILWVALDNGIYIPKLCTIREQNEPLAACRLCFIESKKANPEPTGSLTNISFLVILQWFFGILNR